ncbi:hypothetical protein ES754_07380 [Psychrobacter frigidicola]|uniref:Uncharacterized protein n=1 Tax=Psychrobacter frigidicola TaxID=45611 RepID=A0A5C7A7W4_9GAMM|nr:hypothetical protein [Psychrobacter frigidicola]TXD96850.1 hypothetical protein ES754_07380 [Psychrobacter frigidicola]
MTQLQIFTLCAWVLYVPYHFIMQQWSQGVSAAIRIDLLFIYPMLALLTLAVIFQWLRKYYKRLQK